MWSQYWVELNRVEIRVALSFSLKNAFGMKL